MILDPEGDEICPEIARLPRLGEGALWWQLWKDAIFYWDGSVGGLVGMAVRGKEKADSPHVLEYFCLRLAS